MRDFLRRLQTGLTHEPIRANFHPCHTRLKACETVAGRFHLLFKGEMMARSIAVILILVLILVDPYLIFLRPVFSTCGVDEATRTPLVEGHKFEVVV